MEGFQHRGIRHKFAGFLLFLAAIPLNGASGTTGSDSVRVFLEEAVNSGKVAGGSVLVIHKGEVVFAEGFGFADLKSRTPFRVDTPAVIASISKPVLATVAFRLIEKGELDQNLPISHYLPAFDGAKLASGEALTRAPTIQELFTHTSGMRNDTAPGGRPWYATWTQGKPLADVVDRFAREFPFHSPPGTRFSYSGIGTDTAARILEVAGERTRNTLVVEEVARPLGMKNTYYRDAESLKKLPAMPSRYYRDDKGKLRLSALRPIPPKDTYSSSGGSIISTAPDLARWLLMIRNRGRVGEEVFLAPETIAEMLSPYPPSKTSKGGLFIRRKGKNGNPVVFGHSGSSGTNCWIDFENDLIGIMITQTRAKDLGSFRVDLEKKVTKSVALTTPLPASVAD